MDSLDQNRLVDRFMKYARVLSPTLGEIEFQRLLLEELSALGISAENDGSGRNGAGNLFAVVPGTEQSLSPILFCMHTDTVECSGRIDPKIVDGCIQSDGTTILGADDKAAVAAMMEALYWLKETRPSHGGLELLFTWGEENGHQGSKAFDASRVRSPFAFAPDEGGPPGRIVTRGPSYDLIRAAFQGRAAHAGVSPESGISAIKMAARAIAAMPLGRIDSETTANVGRIFGGTARNVVPELVELEGEARSLNPEKINRQVESMREIMESAARESGGEVRVQVTRMYDGFQIEEDEPPVVIAAAAARAVGLSPIIASTGGGTDAHELNAKGLPSVILSMGAQDMHSKNEHIRVADLVKLAEWIGAIVIEGGRRKFRKRGG